MTNRRTFVGVITAGLIAARLSAAQLAGKVWRIGFIGTLPPTTGSDGERIWDAFRLALQERGYVEGKNLVFERRYSEGNIERFPALAAELVSLKVDVIVVGSAPGVRAAMAASAKIPIVMSGVSDPVGAGLIASLARPGGNVTGMTDYQLDLVPKRLELLKAVAPKALRVANVQGNFSGFDAGKLAALVSEQDAAARALGVTLLRLPMNTPQDFDATIATIVRERPDALLLSPNATNFVLRKELAEFALRQRLPAMAARREEAVAGTLMSYGTSTADMLRGSAAYVDKIFNGANPADLPVEQPTKFEMVINLKTAKALGLTIPQSLLLRADEVIR